MAEMIKLNSKIDDAEFGAYHVEARGRRRGGVVVIQEIFGIDEYVRADCERWAALGFEALAPSLFDRFEPGFEVEHSPDGIQAGFKHAQANTMDNALADVQTCIDFLKAKGPVFATGYCYGGSIVWLGAHHLTGLAAGASYYGGTVLANAALKPRCPVIVHLGRKDSHIPADEVQAALRGHHAHVPVYIYENSGHGFNNEGGPGWDDADARLARKRTLELFEQNGAL